MIDLETHECGVCGEQFIAACESQLQEKLKNHKCPKLKRTNRKRERTRQLEQAGIALYLHDLVIDRIEEHNFNELVKKGVVVCG